MTTAAQALSAQAAQLPTAERIEVVERILDSLTSPMPYWKRSGPMKPTTAWPPIGAVRSRLWHRLL